MLTIGAIVSAAVSVVKALAVADVAIKGLKAIGNVLTSIGKALGIIKPETKVEDLGDKAIQSGFKPEEFDNYVEYVKAVEAYDLDPEKSKLTTEEDKIKRGMELAAGVAVEKFEGFPIQELCIAVGQNPEYFTAEKMGEITKLMQADGQNISTILNFVNGSENDSVKIQNATDMLTAVEKSVNPSISDKDAYKNVMGLVK